MYSKYYLILVGVKILDVFLLELEVILLVFYNIYKYSTLFTSTVHVHVQYIINFNIT